jgi:hypothetical protein
MIGRVEWEERPGLVVALTLGDDGVFVADDPRWDVLAETHTGILPQVYRDPTDGPFGVRYLKELADRNGGTFVIERKPGPRPGTIF